MREVEKGGRVLWSHLLERRLLAACARPHMLEVLTWLACTQRSSLRLACTPRNITQTSRRQTNPCSPRPHHAAAAAHRAVREWREVDGAEQPKRPACGRHPERGLAGLLLCCCFQLRAPWQPQPRTAGPGSSVSPSAAASAPEKRLLPATLSVVAATRLPHAHRAPRSAAARAAAARAP